MIEIKNLTFKYEMGTKNALSNINLNIEDGGFVGIIGPSGSGKSTLTYAVNGVIPHHFKGEYYGKVLVDGKDVDEVIATLKGIKCRSTTSCGDQLALALIEYKEKLNNPEFNKKPF